MIYPLDEPLYSVYILPITNVINKYFNNEGIMLSNDPYRSTKTKFFITIDLLLDAGKARTRIMTIGITNELEVFYVFLKVNSAVAPRMIDEIQQIVPQAKVEYVYIWGLSRLSKHRKLLE